jgi:hypothetical protein
MQRRKMMPYIKTITNAPISADKRESIKAQLGQDISLLGKSESWLMVDFQENSPLYFKGSSDPAAIVSVDLYGAARPDAYSKLTASVTKLLTAQLEIPPDRVFVKYTEYTHWGFNGSNF